MQVDLYAETGQLFENKEQVASGIQCMIDDLIELPGYVIEVKQVN